MNVPDFTQLLQNPNKVVSPIQTKQLEDVLEEYPYFQAARSMHLKGLKNLNSFKYNNALKVTAAYTADREVLFDFITSKEFVQDTIADTILGKDRSLNNFETVSEEIPYDEPAETVLTQETQDKPLPQNIKEAEQILDPSLFKSKDPAMDRAIEEAKKAEQDLELGKPLPFTKKEKYSFGEWLQLTSSKPIRQSPGSSHKKTITKEKGGNAFQLQQELQKKKKFELIDKFIENNPKIDPKEHSGSTINIEESVQINKNELMTETLARVYVEQKNYKKAIKAYKILSLKYPEKSSFFADRIKSVQKIQQQNSNS